MLVICAGLIENERGKLKIIYYPATVDFEINYDMPTILQAFPHNFYYPRAGKIYDATINGSRVKVGHSIGMYKDEDMVEDWLAEEKELLIKHNVKYGSGYKNPTKYLCTGLVFVEDHFELLYFKWKDKAIVSGSEVYVRSGKENKHLVGCIFESDQDKIGTKMVGWAPPEMMKRLKAEQKSILHTYRRFK